MIVKIDFRMCLISNTHSFFNEIPKKCQLENGGHERNRDTLWQLENSCPYGSEEAYVAISSFMGFLDIMIFQNTG